MAALRRKRQASKKEENLEELVRSGEEGAYTLVYRFIDSDNNVTNDVGVYNFNLAQNLVDLSFEAQDITSQLENLANLLSLQHRRLAKLFFLAKPYFQNILRNQRGLE